MLLSLFNFVLLYGIVALAAAFPAFRAPRFSAQRPFEIRSPLSSPGRHAEAQALVGILDSPSINAANGPLRNYQVQHPILLPKSGGHSCSMKLLEHDFGNSYSTLDQPKIVEWKPASLPEDCRHSWAKIVLNLTVTSNGTQFDRLASISLSHVEISRTSTAEPTRDGIIWTVEKDVTRFSALFDKPGRFMFELNNIVNEHYTGIFSVSLDATFYSPTKFPVPTSADLILPISTQARESSQMLIYPGDASSAVQIPSNTAQAFLEVLATGARYEEFWYTNVLDQYRAAFPDAGLIGKGPFREVQLRIDGLLAGVVHPFPVIYTGGANPLLWRPIASLRAFDIPSFWIDVTPYLPILTDDRTHNFSFSVVGQGKHSSINSNWFITAALHLKLDPTFPPVRTNGSILEHSITPLPDISTDGEVSDDGKRLETTVKAARSMKVTTLLETGPGKKLVSTSMSAYFENTQQYGDGGAYEHVEQTTSVVLTSSHDREILLRDVYSFPLSITTNYSSLPSSFSADLPFYAYNRALTLPPALDGGDAKTKVTKSTQAGWAEIVRKEGNFSVGSGEMEEKYRFSQGKETYTEEIKAANSTIVARKRGGSLARQNES